MNPQKYCNIEIQTRIKSTCQVCKYKSTQTLNLTKTNINTKTIQTLHFKVLSLPLPKNYKLLKSINMYI